MRIAITQRITNNTDYYEPRDALAHDWIVYLEKLFPGSVVIPIPNALKSADAWLDNLNPDLVILSNGNDVGSEQVRDNTEKTIVEWCFNDGSPLLAVCRGAQFLANLAGAELSSQLKNFTQTPHVATHHEIMIVDERFSFLANGRTLVVNSYHNQGVLRATLPKEIIPFAMAEDDVVEGFCWEGKVCMAIMWHPERQNQDQSMTDELLLRFYNGFLKDAK